MPQLNELDFDALLPMLLSEARFDMRAPNFLWELKYDGYRLLAKLASNRVRLRTRNGADATHWFPEVTRGLSQLPRSAVLDGEVCVLDEYGRPDFDRLHARASRRGYRTGDDLVVFCVFDLLELGSEPLLDTPLLERKALLAQLMAGAPPSTLFVQHVQGAAEGAWLYEQAVGLKLEGVVAKRMDSVYQPGMRSPDWYKRKRPNATNPQRFRRP